MNEAPLPPPALQVEQTPPGLQTLIPGVAPLSLGDRLAVLGCERWAVVRASSASCWPPALRASASAWPCSVPAVSAPVVVPDDGVKAVSWVVRVTGVVCALIWSRSF